MRDGTIIIAKFVDRLAKYILLEGHRLRREDVISFTIYKKQR